jgi:hypothetical protein
VLPAGALDGGLGSISCSGPNACTAVGHANGALAERWNGRHWSVATLPAGTGSGGLTGVSCPAPGSCAAVGSSPINTGTDQPLAESYAGGAWTMEPISPPAGSSQTDLEGVSCGSSRACVAVGEDQSSTTGDLFDVYATWDGSNWTMAPFSPALIAHSGPLGAISCATATRCLAVGSRTAERFG